MVVARQVPQPRPPQSVAAARDLQRADGGLGEYYSEHETRTPVWLLAGDKVGAARLVGLSDVQRAEARPIPRWSALAG